MSKFFLSIICKNASLLNTASKLLSSNLYSPGFVQINFALSDKFFFNAKLFAVSITNGSGSIPITSFAPYFSII